MRAVRIHHYGGGDQLMFEEAPLPEIGTDDVLIRVHAAAVNPVDWKIREGYLSGWFNHSLPLTLGWDIAGVVEAVGASVMDFREGDSVYARADVSRNGGYADYIAVPASCVALKPPSVDFIHAAAIANAGLAAWQSLFDAAGLEAGQTVLVHGGAGGVGHLAVQLAKWRGARVIATASRENHEFLRQLGVDEIIDYNVTPFEEVCKDVDVVLDTVGGETQKRSWAVLRPGGVLVSLVEPPAEETAQAHGVQQRFVAAQSNTQNLTKLVDLVDSGHLVPMVSKILPLGEAQQAHTLIQTGHTCGKIVLQVSA